MIVIFPMTGSLSFGGDDFRYPKPLIELNDKTMLENAIEAFLDIPQVEFRFIIKNEDDRRFKLSSLISQATGGKPFKIVTVPDETSGALCSALMALPFDNGREHEGVVISNYDQIFDVSVSWLIDQVSYKNTDFGLASFESIHPKWSYVRLDSEGFVCEASEKRPISNYALCGFYFFSDKSVLRDAIINVLKTASPTKENFYVSEVLNQLVLMGKRGRVQRIPRNSYVNFYEPNIVHEYQTRNIRREGLLVKSTQGYAHSFHNRDIETVLTYFSEDAILSDPSVRLVGKNEIANFLKKFFDKNPKLHFISKSIWTSEDSSVIHFELVASNKKFFGVDVIHWVDGRILSLQAYLTEENDEGA